MDGVGNGGVDVRVGKLDIVEVDVGITTGISVGIAVGTVKGSSSLCTKKSIGLLSIMVTTTLKLYLPAINFVFSINNIISCIKDHQCIWKPLVSILYLYYLSYSISESK